MIEKLLNFHILDLVLINFTFPRKVLILTFFRNNFFWTYLAFPTSTRGLNVSCFKADLPTAWTKLRIGYTTSNMFAKCYSTVLLWSKFSGMRKKERFAFLMWYVYFAIFAIFSPSFSHLRRSSKCLILNTECQNLE